MTTAVRHRAEEPFDIHEDAATEETEMMVDDNIEDVDPAALHHVGPDGDVDEGDEEEDGEEEEEEDYESSDDEKVESSVKADMDKLQQDFPGFRDKYRLIKRIGEGTFSTVFKAEDLHYEHFDNSWDIEDSSVKWTPPPLKRDSDHNSQRLSRKRARYVAIKKIYVTSSPARILNELELLHDLRQCPSVCPLITAFRATDQVVAILPYFRHGDFRAYFRDMTIPDIAIYL